MGKELINKVITGIKISDDKEAILFEIAEGNIIAGTYGECCSSTWIESVEIPALGFPAKVIAVGDLDMPNLGDLPGCDVVAYYGFKIITDKGEIIIDYRNDSNGYYGGDLVWGDSYYLAPRESSKSWISVEKLT